MIEYSQTDIDKIYKLFSERPVKYRNLTIDEYATITTISRGRFRGQRHDNSRAPYMVEIMREMSPQSETQEIYIMAASQFGKSYTSGIISSYYTTEIPAEQLYVTGAEESSKKWLEREYEPRVLSMGVEFKPENQDKQNKRSGNKTSTKTYPGGVIDIATAGSINQLSSDTKRIIIADEIDRYPKQLAAGQGSAWDNMMARAKQWGSQRKILGISTPTTYDESLIYKLFLTGDQCYYHVPCPLCGEMQEIVIFGRDGYGLTWQTSKDVVVESSVEYICKKCNKGFSDKYKFDMLKNGSWIKTAEPNPYVRSFQVSTLMSNFESWYNVAIDYNKMLNGQISRQGFWNLTGGKPYRDIGSRPRVEKIIENRGSYKSLTVPRGVLYLTIGADVQQGAERYRQMSNEELDQVILQAEDKEYLEKSKLPRIELEILGHGRSWRTASIGYLRFYGRVNDPYSGAFKKLQDWAEKTDLIFYDQTGRRKYDTKIIFIDSGDQSPEVQNVVQSFCTGWNNTYPIKGFYKLKTRKDEKKDEVTGQLRRYRIVKDGNDYLYQINTIFYKEKIYQNLKIPRDLDSDILTDQRPGFCDFPIEYNENYFNMLTAAEKTTDGGFNSGNRQDEALDCRVYNMCAGDVYLDSLVQDTRMKYKDKVTHDQLRAIDHNFVLDIVERSV